MRPARADSTSSISSTSAAAFRPPTTKASAHWRSWPGCSTPRSSGFSRRTSRSSPSRDAAWWPRRPRSVVKVIGKAVRNGQPCYYVDNGVYHTFSGIIFDHCKYHLKAFRQGPTRELLGLRADLRRPGHHLAGRGTAGTRTGRSALRENIGAYSHASSTWFNGFPPAKVLHINV